MTVKREEEEDTDSTQHRTSHFEPQCRRVGWSTKKFFSLKPLHLLLLLILDRTSDNDDLTSVKTSNLPIADYSSSFHTSRRLIAEKFSH